MDKATKLVDELIKTMTPKPNSSLSESITSYQNGIELIKTSLESEFKNGYAQAEKDLKEKKVNHQIKNN